MFELAIEGLEDVDGGSNGGFWWDHYNVETKCSTSRGGGGRLVVAC